MRPCHRHRPCPHGAHQHEKRKQSHQRECVHRCCAMPWRKHAGQRHRQQKAAHRWPSNIRNLEYNRPPRHRVHKVVLGHQAGQQRGRRWPAERAPQSNPQKHRIDRPHPQGRMQRKPHQRDRAYRLNRIAHQDDPAPIVPVGHMSRGEDKDDPRRKQRQAGEAQGERRMRDLVNLPCHRNRLRLRPQDHQQPRHLIQPEVAREKGAAHARLHCLRAGARLRPRGSSPAPTPTLCHIALMVSHFRVNGGFRRFLSR